MLSRDGRLLFATRFARMFAYGALSVVLALYLAAEGFDGVRIGLILTLTLVGDAAISLWLTTHADAVGRRRVLVAGALLMTLGGLVFALTNDFWVLVVAATIGVISPSGNEVGPFLAVEQAALSHIVPDRERTRIFGWYAVFGSVATASGALAAGALAAVLQSRGVDAVDSYRVTILGYAAMGLLLAAGFWLVSSRVEVAGARDVSVARRLGLGRSRGVVLRLAALFALDAFGGGLVMQSLIALWLERRFGADPATIGAIFFAANLLAAGSALAATRIASRFGLINTMVFTHLPSNILLILVPLMPSLETAMAVLLARFAISQMDVPTRQSYTMAVVDPDERSAAAGVTGIARSIGAAISPAIAAPLVVSGGLAAVPFLAAGALKILYDVLLFRAFRSMRPPEERPDEQPPNTEVRRGTESG